MPTNGGGFLYYSLHVDSVHCEERTSWSPPFAETLNDGSDVMSLLSRYNYRASARVVW